MFCNQLKFILFFLYIISSVFAHCQSHSRKICYVSSTTGCDTNDGSINFPFKTIGKAIESRRDTILLKSGDTFYEYMELDGCIVDKYGSGDKPILCGVKIPYEDAWENGILENGKWSKCKGSIWRINLGLDDDKYLGYRTGGSSFLNNAGAIVNLSTNDMNNCRKVPSYDELNYNFDFWQDCPIENTGSATPQDFDYLYLYLESDPNKYNLGITMGTHAVSIRNGEIRNVGIKYWGFGIVFKDNVTISNCDIDGIGGHIVLGKNRKWALLGNGLETWITPPARHNCLIENCTVSRTFDCGATLQGHNSKNSIRAENIIFRNNTFRNCCQSFEEFLRGPEENDVYDNCIVEDNLSIDAGINTGFRYYDGRYKRCHFLSNSTLRNTNLIIRNNTAINGNYYCAGEFNKLYRQAQWHGNTCYIKRGQDLLGNYRGTKDVITLPNNKEEYSSLKEATESAISRYRTLTGDETTKFIIIE